MNPRKILERAVQRTNPKVVLFQLLKSSTPQNASKTLKYIKIVGKISNKFGLALFTIYPRDLESGVTSPYPDRDIETGDPPEDERQRYRQYADRREKILSHKLIGAPLRIFIKFLDSEADKRNAVTICGDIVGLPI